MKKNLKLFLALIFIAINAVILFDWDQKKNLTSNDVSIYECITNGESLAAAQARNPALPDKTIATEQADEMNPQLTAYFQQASVTEFGCLTGTAQQVADFTGFLKVNWVKMLDDIQKYAMDEARQSVIVVAAESLPPTEYMAFMSKLLDKYQEGKVKKSVAFSAMSAGGGKYFFLAVNYRNTSVIALCNRAKTLFPDDADLQSLMTDTLNGAQQKTAEVTLFIEGLPKPETLP